MVKRVAQGKGRKDRYVMPSPSCSRCCGSIGKRPVQRVVALSARSPDSEYAMSEWGANAQRTRKAAGSKHRQRWRAIFLHAPLRESRATIGVSLKTQQVY